MNPNSRNIAVISADPANLPVPPEPAGNRSDAIQIGGTPSGTQGEGGGGGLTVPGLTVRGESGAPAAVSSVAAPPRPAAALAIPTRPAPLPPPVASPSVAIAQWPSARRVPVQVESAFRNRPVFTTIFSPAGSPLDCVMWFGDLEPIAPGTRVFMRPPSPRQTMWAAKDANDAWPAKLWLRARLAKDGALSQIAAASSESESATAAVAPILSSWLFTPAVRNGVTIDTDIVLEVSFGRVR